MKRVDVTYVLQKRIILLSKWFDYIPSIVLDMCKCLNFMVKVIETKEEKSYWRSVMLRNSLTK